MQGTGLTCEQQSIRLLSVFLTGDLSELPVSPRADHCSLETSLMGRKFSACRLLHVVFVTASVLGRNGGLRPPPRAPVGLAGAAVAPEHAGRAQTGTSTTGGPRCSKSWSRAAGIREHRGGSRADRRAGRAAIWDGPRPPFPCSVPCPDSRVLRPSCTLGSNPGSGRSPEPRRGALRGPCASSRSDGCRGAALSRRRPPRGLRLLGEALSPLSPPRRLNLASYCKSK